MEGCYLVFLWFLCCIACFCLGVRLTYDSQHKLCTNDKTKIEFVRYAVSTVPNDSLTTSQLMAKFEILGVK